MRIDLARHLVSIRGEPVNLTRSEFQVLRLLAERPGQVFSRLEIMEELWQSEFSGDVRACDVHISNLRQKVERDPQEPELVLTVRGVGYKLAEGWASGPPGWILIWRPAPAIAQLGQSTSLVMKGSAVRIHSPACSS